MVIINSPASNKTFYTLPGQPVSITMKGTARTLVQSAQNYSRVQELDGVYVKIGNRPRIRADITGSTTEYRTPEWIESEVETTHSWEASFTVSEADVNEDGVVMIRANPEGTDTTTWDTWQDAEGNDITKPTEIKKLSGGTFVNVRVVADATKPMFDANFKDLIAEFPVPAGGAPRSIELTGWARDDESGIDRVAVAVVKDGVYGPFMNATPGADGWASWSATVGVPGTPGQHTIITRAWNRLGSSSGVGLTATLVDRTAPEVTIAAQEQLVYDKDPLTFTARGTARDDQTGVKLVNVRLVELLSDHSERVVVEDVQANLEGETNWNATLAVNESGNYMVVAEAFDRGFPAENRKIASTSLTVVDMPMPVVDITYPVTEEDRRIRGDEDGVLVKVAGTAKADHSMVTVVEARLGNAAAWTRATPLAPGWSTWEVELLVPSAGAQTITVRATSDAKHEHKNTGVDQVVVDVNFSYKPRDTENNISLLAYSTDLIKFAGRRVIVGEGAEAPRLRANHLEAAFFQPFGRLTVNEPVQQVRICVEVLRAYLASMGKDLAGVAQSYCQAAYHALLVQFGTSYDELRLGRGASADERSRLAGRLGIDLSEGPSADGASRPDRLDELLLTPSQMREDKLEQIFGLVDTSRDPLEPPKDTPALFDWQMAHLRLRWYLEDHPSAGGAGRIRPLLDPDIVGEDDLAEPAVGKPVYDLWLARRTWILDQRARLAESQLPGEDDPTRFERLVNETLAPKKTTFADSQALAAKERAGEDIAVQVAELRLSRPAFNTLLHFGGLAAESPLLDTEWSDVYDILVEVVKAREFDRWRMEEKGLVIGPKNVGLILGPDHFVEAEAPASPPRWRADAEARHAWQEALLARIAQQNTLMQAFDTSIRAAEAATLPILRDALIAAFGATPGIDMANWLTERLMIDVRASGELRTTRITQAIETLQSTLIALRTGRFMEMGHAPAPSPPMPAPWRLDILGDPGAPIDQIFDSEWRWMGTYANWRAATRTFVYPENQMLPVLRRDRGMQGAFAGMLEALARANPVTQKAARDEAGHYLKAIVVQHGAALDALAKKAWPMEAQPDWKIKTFVLNEQLAEADLPKRAAAIEVMMLANNGTNPLQSVLDELFYWAPMQLGLDLRQVGQYAAALDWFRTTYGYNLPPGQRKVYHGLKQEEAITSVYNHTDQWLRTQLNPYDIAPMRRGAITRFTILSIVRCFIDYADAEFAEESGESLARARTLYLAALDLLASADMHDIAIDHGFNPNPDPIAARAHAELNLSKLQSGRNIAGMQRFSQSYVQQGGDEIEVRGFSGLKPTPYRYSVLIERAKQLVTIAQQMESAYLAALEKRDAETYNLLKAGQHLGLAQASVRLQALRVTEAAGGVKLAAAQKERAELLRATYDKWIQEGPIWQEKRMLEAQRSLTTARNWVAGADAALTAAQAFASAASMDKVLLTAGTSFLEAGILSVVATGKSIAQVAANNAERRVQEASVLASQERRRQEWTLHRSLADKDIAIGRQQIVQSRDNLRVVMQEQNISEMQLDHAQAEVDFLAHKFTSAELYAWMSNILGRVYSYFLQQAAAIARLAQAQLAFERQERPLSLIRADYWQAPAESVQQTSSSTPDRRGLTGSARLLQDIYQLDQYAFDTNKRKLQLSKTISLAQLAPFELEQFRKTGVLPFRTPMSLFDQDFPGHYLRLVRKVRTSVVALVPPSQGIRATLESSGISRVTVGDAAFQDVLVRRDPELVALTSPVNATGLFDLDVQSDMLLPFENIGVDTGWLLQMPKASNPFNYDTIADVLITIEYTALHSPSYRQQVIRRLDRKLSADRAFSMRSDFPDQWYDLNNPPAAGGSSIRVETSRSDFPPNLSDLRMEQVLLYFRSKGDVVHEAEVTRLRFTPADGVGAVESRLVRTVNNVISTRRSSAGPWTALLGRSPAGTWELELSAATLALLREGAFEDMTLSITYQGMTPSWPA